MRKYITLYLVILTYTFSVKVQAQDPLISETHYDYKEKAEQIVSGCNNKLEQARSIYQWISQNIAYDTNYRIHTADECYEKRRGICIAYCELFYRLGEPLGLKTTIIHGRSKDQRGQIANTKHAWLCVEVEDGNILIDPTWGAGSIIVGKFIQNKNDMSWFHIDPYWLIFTHYPDNKDFQFIDNPINWNTFVKLPSLYPSSTEYGWNGKKVFTNLLNGETQSLPKIYHQYSSLLTLIDIPMRKDLRPGHTYTFTVQKKQENEIVLIHEGEFIHENEWLQNGDNLTLHYMPVSAGTVNLSIAKADKKYNAVVVYHVPKPTAAELKNIERHVPLKMPEIKNLKNFDLKRWETIEVNASDMLKIIRKERITSLPILYKNAEKYLRKIVIPFNETLTVGQTYTFSFIPQGGLVWKIINEKDWQGDWQIDESTGRYTMTITPKHTGKLRISVQTVEGGAFNSMIGYQVK